MTRVPTTPEDNCIAIRNLRRLARWDRELHPPLPSGEVVGSNLLGTMARACGDYIEAGPVDWSDWPQHQGHGLRI